MTKRAERAKGAKYTCGCFLGGDTNDTPTSLIPKLCPSHGKPVESYYVMKDTRYPPNRIQIIYPYG